MPAFALLGGMAAYLLAHVSFRFRHVHTINTRRAGLAILLVALLPVAVEIPALATVAVVTVLDVAPDRVRDAQLRRGAPTGEA